MAPLSSPDITFSQGWASGTAFPSLLEFSNSILKPKQRCFLHMSASPCPSVINIMKPSKILHSIYGKVFIKLYQVLSTSTITILNRLKMVYGAFLPKLVILRKKKKSDTIKGLIKISLPVPKSLKTFSFFFFLSVGTVCLCRNVGRGQRVIFESQSSPSTLRHFPPCIAYANARLAACEPPGILLSHKSHFSVSMLGLLTCTAVQSFTGLLRI